MQRTFALFSPAALALALGCAATARAAEPFSFDTAPGRLPKNVVPIDYVVALVPDLAARALAGEESITLEFREPSATIQFNGAGQALQAVRLDDVPVASAASDAASQLVTVGLAAPAPPGRHRLSFSFSGNIGSAPPGIFAQEYLRPDGAKGVLLTTKFEPTYARRMFPCWDEPAFRSSFELTVTLPAQWAAVANMPLAKRIVHGSTATLTFERTPPMPVYLVELSAGDLARIGARLGAATVGMWAVRGQEQDAATALDDAQRILADYNEYFGLPYPLPKLDSIAVPGGFGGAMENWGAITYNDQSLLLTARSTLADRQRVFDMQAHEIAHQWNGDLVTMGWWDDLWLNESFASWRGASETELRFPSWHWWETLDAQKERAMRADARTHVRAVEQHVADELQAQGNFDPDITYNKGTAVLRMLEAWLGPETFRDGVRRFIKAHAYANATSADLWNALGAASGRDVRGVAAAWTEQPGFPLVSVAAHCDAQGRRTISLSQERFLLEGSDPGQARWHVPLLMRVGETGVARPLLLTPSGQPLAAGNCGQPLSVNAGAVGYYRVAYDGPTLEANTRAFARLARADRIVLLDDQWALVESGAQPLASYLALVRALDVEAGERAWDQVLGALAMIEHDERATSGYSAFTAFARAVLQPLAQRLGWAARPGETPGTQALRRAVLRDLGDWGDADVLAEARRRLAMFQVDPGSIAPDDQEFIFSIVARHADAESFGQLHAIARQAANETELRRYYRALMRVTDPQLAARAAAIAMSDEIPPQAASLRVQLLFILADAHAQLSWSTFSANFAALTEPYQPYTHLILAQNVPQMYWDGVPAGELETWVRARVPAQFEPYVARSMEAVRFRLREKAALVQAADDYLALPVSALRAASVAPDTRRRSSLAETRWHRVSTR